MNIDTPLVQISIALFSLTTVALHLSKKNFDEVILYAGQSLAVVLLLATVFWRDPSLPLLGIVLLTLLVKMVLAPLFFARLIRRHELKFAVDTYLGIAGSLSMITLTLLFVSSGVMAPLTTIVPENHTGLVLALTMLLTSIFLIVNRKGALSQVVGVLSMENSILAFGLFAELESSPMLQAGVAFDVLMWLMIAVVMLVMVYRHIGSLNTTNLKGLRE